MDIVRWGENPHTLDAACCSVEVVNGGYGWRVFGCCFTYATRRPAPSRSSTSVAACSWLCTSGFSSSRRASLAMKAVSFVPFDASTPSTQYATGLNAAISRSRSTRSRRAADCTRPAESE